MGKKRAKGSKMLSTKEIKTEENSQKCKEIICLCRFSCINKISFYSIRRNEKNKCLRKRRDKERDKDTERRRERENARGRDCERVKRKRKKDRGKRKQIFSWQLGIDQNHSTKMDYFLKIHH